MSGFLWFIVFGFVHLLNLFVVTTLEMCLDVISSNFFHPTFFLFFYDFVNINAESFIALFHKPLNWCLFVCSLFSLLFRMNKLCCPVLSLLIQSFVISTLLLGPFNEFLFYFGNCIFHFYSFLLALLKK